MAKTLEFSDQPWKIVNMKKLTYAFALMAGLAYFSAAPSSALAGSLIQTLDTPELSSSQFSSLFQPIAAAPVLQSPFQFYGAPVSGDVWSQVFQGTGAAAGLYAYAYAVSVNNVSNNSGEPVHVDSLSWQFNGTPTVTNFAGSPAAAYIVNGPVGGINPSANSSGVQLQTPSSLSWAPGSAVGTIRADYVNPSTQTPPLGAGSNSATFVLITNQPYSQQFVNLQSSNPQIGSLTPVYAATGGQIYPVPVPEPATLLAWTGVIGAAALARRFRGRRNMI